MANINNLTSYPTATPFANSIVIGSIAANLATNNFLMSDIATFVMGANTLTLQDVCDNGTATTTGITVAGTTTLNGTVDINNTADIADTLTLSRATGTGLAVTANIFCGGDIGVNGEVTTVGLRLLVGSAPATATSTGSAGQIKIDADYIYVCTATNTWKRVAIATWV